MVLNSLVSFLGGPVSEAVHVLIPNYSCAIDLIRAEGGVGMGPIRGWKPSAPVCKGGGTPHSFRPSSSRGSGGVDD
jgi:hypothetical protein